MQGFLFLICTVALCRLIVALVLHYLLTDPYSPRQQKPFGLGDLIHILSSGPSRQVVIRSSTEYGIIIMPIHMHCFHNLLCFFFFFFFLLFLFFLKRQDFSLLPRLECSEEVIVQCSLKFMGASSPPSAS